VKDGKRRGGRKGKEAGICEAESPEAEEYGSTCSSMLV
jgi:hypothetical protein